MSRPWSLGAARTAAEKGDVTRAVNQIQDALMTRDLGLGELQELQQLLAELGPLAKGRTHAQCDRLASAVDTRMRPMVEENEAYAESRARLAIWPGLPPDVARMDDARSDPLLLALARVAETGQECAPVRVMTANGLFIGRPGPPLGFLEAMRIPLSARSQAEPLPPSRFTKRHQSFSKPFTTEPK